MTTTIAPPVLVAASRPAPGVLVTDRPECDVLPASHRTEALRIWSALEDDLRAGRDESARVPLTAGSTWTSAWLTAFGDVVPHEFLIVRQSDRPVGAVLLTRGIGRRIGPFRLRTRHVGTAGEDPRESACVEYNDLLALPDSRATVQELLLTHVLRDKSWGSFCLDGFSPAALHGMLQDLRGFELRYRDCPYYDLQATRDKGGDLLDPLGRSTRQNLRRLLRKYGEIDVEWAESADAARDVLAELIELHQARWQAAGERGAFHSRRFRTFQETLVGQAFAGPAEGRPVVLVRARSGGETLGCLMLLADGGRLLDYLSGFADFRVQASPGLVTHTLAMQAALDRGYAAYDFLVGEKRHKANLSTNVNQLVWATWTRTTVTSRTIAAARKLKQLWGKFRPRSASLPIAEQAE